MRYPIGTRVRNIESASPSRIGAEGTVVGYASKDELSADPDHTHAVEFDDFQPPPPGEYWRCRHDQLEPIINDGNNLTTWDECVWQPGKVMS